MSIVISGNYIAGNIKGIISTVAPTTATTGILGQLYVNTADNNKTYICTSINGNVFTWSEISGGSSSVSIDDLTITENSSNEIQAVGQIELNSNTATFDWVGSLQEYTAGRQAQTITDDMICYITDDYDTPTDVVSDVLVGGTSVVTDGVANIPVAGQDTLGVSKVSPTYGLTISNGLIVGSTKTESVYSTAANSLVICRGTLENIKTTLGPDVQINGTSILSSGVANIPIAGANSLGVMKVNENTYGIGVNQNNGLIYIKPATDSEIDSKTSQNKPIVPSNLNYAVRSVQPAYTAIEASTASATLAINSTYGQTPSVPVAYIIPAPTAGVDNWIKMFIDTSSVASISFTTTGGVSISPNQISGIEIGHKYMVVINYDNLHASWALFIKDMGTV